MYPNLVTRDIKDLHPWCWVLWGQMVCFYCNKPGHLKKDCYKLRNDLSGNRGAGGSRGGRAGRYGGGRGAGGR